MNIPVRRGKDVKAGRGTALRCKGWRQEAILRMLENNLENGEAPDNLVIYMSIARAARDWKSFDRIVATLTTMREDQTLVMQSGKPIGVFPGQATTPLVIMANGNIVGDWSGEESRRKLDDMGLTVYPGMTAAAWQYIGSQGILQGTYETFMSVGRQHFGGTLAGRLLLTSGCGGMSGAQPLAGKLAGASTLVVEVDQVRIDRRIASGYCDATTDDLDDAIARWLAARDARQPLALALCANSAAVLPELARRGIVPDVVTDQTYPDPLKGYVPAELSVAQARAMRQEDPAKLMALARQSVATHLRAILGFMDRGAIAFEYGNSLRAEARAAGVEDAFRMRSFVDLYIRPLFCQGMGPFRWIALSGDPQDIYTVDDMILDTFSSNHPISSWIRLAREHVKFTGLPARIGWLGYGERSRLALLVNEAVANGKISAPIAFTRDHLDSGSAALPHRETENMKDGSDAIADWPILNALLNCSSGADLVAIHGLGGRGVSAGLTIVADGNPDTAERLKRVLDGDPGIGVLRHADAGYDIAIEQAGRFGLSETIPPGLSE
ncbi:urocanate hydratase [Bradyrhizobium jicamae]|uniref:Urocanate hydratase n=1 Tax=Bradyrhizobium jicamae TaxID=280332 RepID=A0ABS5FET0_9BRAD|nr:urocanate hydratase [Bradyrhizobium jicamae]MBR0795285.1 urocanate hydratase [Bradyrhizobium jicamae]MBR0932707.1 urocanate hydratase [Bradyrhizobium jicamae]